MHPTVWIAREQRLDHFFLTDLRGGLYGMSRRILIYLLSQLALLSAVLVMGP